MPSSDVLVLGGGPAGAYAGTLLARGGLPVTLLERSPGPSDKVCGDFLSGEALGYLHAIGIDARGLGAVPLHRVRLVANTCLAEAELPFPAYSLTRRALDEALLRAAAQAGATVQRGITVEAIARADDGQWHATTRAGTGGDHGERYAAPQVLVAVGKHDLRGKPRPPGRHSGLVAFKQYFRLEPRQARELENTVELILTPGGYAGLQPVEDGRANLCLLIDRKVLHRCGGKWADVLDAATRRSAHLRRRLDGAQPLLARPLALSAIPYGYVRARTESGLWWLGDQAAVIPSFSGDGVSIALHSAAKAAGLLLAGEPSTAFQPALRSTLRRQVGLATTLSQLLVCCPASAYLLRFAPGLLGRIAAHTRVREEPIPEALLALGCDAGQAPEVSRRA